MMLVKSAENRLRAPPVEPQPRIEATNATNTNTLARTMRPALISVAVKLLFFAGMVLSIQSMSVSERA